MGTKVKDYIAAINQKKKKALLEDQENLIINAGELHAECGEKKSPSLIQCCSAMRQCMLTGDEIIQTKENKRGASTALTVSYDLMNMQERKKAFPSKKRGRPSGISNTGLSSKKDTFILDENVANMCIENWMKRNRIKYESYEDLFLANDGYGIWIIIKYRNKKENELFIKALQLIAEDTHKCTVVFKNTKKSRHFWNEISEEVKDRLNLTALFIENDETVLHIV